MDCQWRYIVDHVYTNLSSSEKEKKNKIATAKPWPTFTEYTTHLPDRTFHSFRPSKYVMNIFELHRIRGSTSFQVLKLWNIRSITYFVCSPTLLAFSSRKPVFKWVFLFFFFLFFYYNVLGLFIVSRSSVGRDRYAWMNVRAINWRMLLILPRNSCIPKFEGEKNIVGLCGRNKFVPSMSCMVIEYRNVRWNRRMKTEI